MFRPRLLPALALLVAGCSPQPGSNEMGASNEEQQLPADDDRAMERNERAPPASDNEVQDQPSSPCPPGVEVCIPRGEQPEPVGNRP